MLKNFSTIFNDKYFLLGFFIFIFDIFTKTIANIFLSPKQKISIYHDNIYLFLTTNVNGIGVSQEIYFQKNNIHTNMIFAFSIVWLIVAL